jgi:hypothetical protein
MKRQATTDAEDPAAEFLTGEIVDRYLPTTRAAGTPVYGLALGVTLTEGIHVFTTTIPERVTHISDVGQLVTDTITEITGTIPETISPTLPNLPGT